MSEGLSGGWLSAIALGLVEGLSEFLPISSTGHLIIAAHWLGENSESAKLFEVVIQLGAVLAVCWEYRRRLWNMAFAIGRPKSPDGQLAFVIFLAFLPAAFLGLLLHGVIKAHLFSPKTVAAALIVGGVAILWVENLKISPRINTLNRLGFLDALVIGVAQSLALFPGISRAGATIIGGMLWGLERRCATEFSFLLALPTMFAAVAYDLWQNQALLNWQIAADIAIGFVVSFIVALIVIRALLAYVSRHRFTPFGWYRIGFGLLVLAVL
ncbi:MAG: undecaprenyl-diphosphate phosphatase [Candidatus Zeuxoniibacter abyssi]|nr:MAG: undecaprenyl-diphosphate phosphatase [Candidatus Persebacteraceae bacterium AB1(2)]